jgi:hypothetical protein
MNEQLLHQQNEISIQSISYQKNEETTKTKNK